MYVFYYFLWESIIHYTKMECSIRAPCHHTMSNRNYVAYYEYLMVKRQVNVAPRMQENVFQRVKNKKFPGEACPRIPLAALCSPNFKDLPTALLGTVVSSNHQFQSCTCKCLSYTVCIYALFRSNTLLRGW